jgi:FMN phosphatase YigB (HAD superfamily)
MAKITLVSFDWGDVIVRICHSFREGCEAAGVAYRPEVDAPQLRLSRMALTLGFTIGRVTPDAFFAGLSDACDGRYTQAELRKVHDAWLLGEYPGIGDVIDTLNATPGVETALLSNTNELHWELGMPSDGSTPRFPTASRLTHRHGSHLMGMAKPDPMIFRRFAELTGREPGQILFFDDRPDNIIAARAEGWAAEQIDPDGDSAAQVMTHLRQHGVL